MQNENPKTNHESTKLGKHEKGPVFYNPLFFLFVPPLALRVFVMALGFFFQPPGFLAFLRFAITYQL